MSHDLSLDFEDSIILGHAATRLTVQIFLGGAARLPRLQPSSGKQVQTVDAKRPITHLVLIGESALKATFLELYQGCRAIAYQKTCLQAEMAASVESIDLSFATARDGAQWRSARSKMKDCIDNRFCSWWRKRVS